MLSAKTEVIYSIDSLDATAGSILNMAMDKRIWLFYGEVGAGKTTFIKSLCAHLGVLDNTQSPSFSLINQYLGSKGGESLDIYHIDLYRINHLEEALNIGIEDYLTENDYCFIEWPQIIEPILPKETFKILFEIVDHSSRKVLIL